MTQTKEIQTNFAGSLANFESVKAQIAQKWSPEESELYNPRTNCMPYRKWQENGFYVIPGEKALHSIVIITKKDKTGKIIARYPKKVALFYRLQVSPVN